MVRYDEKILNVLLDSYEKSVLSRGENKVKVQITFPFTKKTVPEYFNESSLAYDEIHAVLKELEQKELLKIAWKKGKEGHIIEKVLLNTSHIEWAYIYLGRTPKKENESRCLKILEAWASKSRETPVLRAFVFYAKQRIQAGKTVKEFVDISDSDRMERILSALFLIENNEESCYIREFSIRHFGDSKAFAEISGVIGKIMRRFRPEFADMNTDAILSEYRIYKTPDYVYLKGEGTLVSTEKESPVMELPLLKQGIGISGADIKNIRICGIENVKRVITIENLTTFFRWHEEGSLIIYLGGYHNSVRRELLRMVYREIPDARYLHFGDIDIGGFRIYRDLCEKTQIPFQTYHMGIRELETYERCTKKLTKNDKKDLRRLIEKEMKEKGENLEVLRYMQQKEVKLEQEAVRISTQKDDIDLQWVQGNDECGCTI